MFRPTTSVLRHGCLTGGTGSSTYGTWAWGGAGSIVPWTASTNTWTVLANVLPDALKTFTCDQAGCRKNTGAPAW